MKILRVFNNNVVLAREDGDDGREVILTGRGLGFQTGPGQPIDPANIVRTFVPDDGRDPDNFGAMVAAIPPEHLALAEQALEAGRAELTIPNSTSLSVALADHLSFAIKRLRDGIAFEYPLRAEVSHLYPAELRAAKRILDHVNATLESPLDEGEAVSIALHLVNAGFTVGDLSFTYQMTGVFTQLFEVLEQASGRPIDRDTVNAARFITHLRYFFVRAGSGKQLAEGATKLRSAIRDSYPDAYATALRLQSVLELRLGEPLAEDEVTYLTLHVARLIDEQRD
ncbi:transcriptional antiterminator, BglG family [Arthrobacter alpinus]|uniref:Transcriptional antiterminator, BglG family n=1 Tax=Arthrobacter alpinus TaxID=656366 RepID=A0A1H5LBI5_9MICC|nr:PRD domain-containing protein [Arthrobacter alpinus]SEE74375.1 transcriptional antiterminator, BglG family [Arthrobacter alpinus]